MDFTLQPITGSDLTLDRDKLTIVRPFRLKGKLPYVGGDCFDAVSSFVMGLIQSTYPMYGTPMGTLYWNSIQLHESFYAQLYEVSVTYTAYKKETGTYMIRVEHAAGTAKATAGERIAGYPSEMAVDNGGVIWNGQEVVGVDVPYNSTRIVLSYRHPQMFLNHAYLSYAPGEIAYAGGNATESEAEASAEYAFEVSYNETNLKVGGITIAEKKGFDVISPAYKWDTEEVGGDTKAVRPIDYIEIIRPRGREWRDYASVFGWGG